MADRANESQKMAKEWSKPQLLVEHASKETQGGGGSPSGETPEYLS